MPAAEYNFVIEQGSDHNMIFQFLDSDSNLIPLSNSGDCVIFKAQPNPTGTSSNFSSFIISSSGPASTEASINFNNQGEIVFFIPASRTRLYNWDTAIYDLVLIRGRLTQNSSSKLRLATGIISLVKSNFPDLSCDTVSTVGDNGDVDSGDNGDGTTGTVPPVDDTTGTAPPADDTIDLCSTLCNNLDLYSEIYQYVNSDGGSSLIINDNTKSFGSIEINSVGIIENLEVVVSGLKHTSVQDLSFVLTPPSGSGVLLSHYQKIANYNVNNGASFVFSTKAIPGIYTQNNTSNNLYVNIYDKTNLHPSGNDLRSSFTHFYGHPASGLWTLNISDDDPGGSGVLDGWGLIVHYNPASIRDDSYVTDWDSFYDTAPNPISD